MLAGVSVLLEGVIGLLTDAVFHGVIEVLMKLLTGKFGVWWEGAVLWGLITLSMRRRERLRGRASFQSTPRRFESFPPHQVR